MQVPEHGLNAKRDVFVSHTWSDHSGAPSRLVDALTTRGVGAWLDANELGPFESIPPAIRQGIGEAKVFVAWYSRQYPTRQACREELTLALLAAERAGEGPKRVLVVNPEDDAEHIIEPMLLDREYADKHLAADVERLADAIAGRVAELDEPFGAIPAPERVRWYGGAGWESRTPIFVGRFGEMWKLHDRLTRRTALVGPGAPGRDSAVVSGMGGIGKSLLVAEYAHLFAAAYPGGVVWLSALGNDLSPLPASSEPANSERAANALRAVAASMGFRDQIANAERVRDEITAHVDAAGLPVLWVVDDLPSGLGQTEIDAWRSKSVFARTVITTRDDRDLGLGAISLVPLDRSASVQLLSQGDSDPGFLDALTLLAEELGDYPLGLAVAGAYIARTRLPVADFIAEISGSTAEFDELVASIAASGSSLPGQHARQIVATLATSLHSLPDESWDLLRIAMPLAPTVLPRRLIEGIFVRLNDSVHAGVRIAAAAMGTEMRDSLWAVDGQTGDVNVHVIVRRSAAHLDPDPDRQRVVGENTYWGVGYVLDALSTRWHNEPQLTATLLQHGRELGDRRPELDVSDLSSVTEYVARLDLGLGRKAVALDRYERVYESRLARLGPEDRDTLTAKNNVANMLNRLARFEEAEVMHRQTRDTRLHRFGPNDPDTLYSQYNLATSLSELNQVETALAMTRDVLVRREQFLKWESPEILATKNNIAHYLATLGDPVSALEMHVDVFDVRVRHLGPTAPDTLLTERHIGLTLGMAGRYALALEIYRETLAARTMTLPADHEDLARSKADVEWASDAVRNAPRLVAKELTRRRLNYAISRFLQARARFGLRSAL